MKVGVFSDLHLHNFQRFSKPGPGGVNSRAQVCLDVLREILAQDCCYGFLFCGDFWHVRWSIPTSLIKPSREILSEGAAYVFAIPGNHDQATVDPFGPNGLSCLDNLLIDVTYRTAVHSDMLPISVVGLPADAPLTKLEPALDAALQDTTYSGKPTALMLHEMISGTEISGSGYVTTDGLTIDIILEYMDKYSIDKCFIGDIHKRQQIHDNIWYVGSALQHGFGDGGQEKGMLIWDTESGEVEEVPIKSPQFLSEDVTSNLPKLEGFNPDNYNYYRIKTCTETYPLAVKRFNNTWNVDILPPKGSVSEVEFEYLDKDTFDDVLKRYVEQSVDDRSRHSLLTDLGKELLSG